MHFLKTLAAVATAFACLVNAAPASKAEVKEVTGITSGGIAARQQGLAWTTRGFFRNTTLSAIRAYREKHGITSPIQWNDNLANFAAREARKCTLAPAPNNQYGEIRSASTYATNPAWYVQEWYDEVVNYNFDEPRFYPSAARFSQLVWTASTQVGCAWAEGCPELRYHMRCEFSPRGNTRISGSWVPGTDFLIGVPRPLEGKFGRPPRVSSATQWP